MRPILTDDQINNGEYYPEEEQFGMDDSYTLKGAIENYKYDLDWLNLEVARYRLKHGISTQMICLYGAMGRLCTKLLALEMEVKRIDSLWLDVNSKSQALQRKGGS